MTTRWERALYVSSYMVPIVFVIVACLFLNGCQTPDPYTKGNHRTIDKVIYSGTYNFVRPNNPKRKR